jgi:hypothetical protein
VQAGIQVAGPLSEQATTFENIYTPHGRIQYIRAVAPQIEPEAVPPAWIATTQIVLLGPVAQEFKGAELLALFPHALIGVTPQGWLRAWDKQPYSPDFGRVRPVLWENPEAVLSRASALILSKEDLPVGQSGQELLQYYVKLSKIVVLTQGVQDCIVYHSQGRIDYVPTLPAQEVDPTGAGDVFATAFLIKLHQTQDPLLAARFAHAAAACNIEKPGLEGVPTLAEIEARLQL